MNQVRGYSFLLYIPVRGNSSETVLCSLKDGQGNLWFGNRNGTLIVYDVKSRRFITYTLLVDGIIYTSDIWAIYIDAEGVIWVGTEKGLLLFEPKKECASVCRLNRN